jgi:SPP1 gp7 family putative phage head morphogenesis protein
MPVTSFAPVPHEEAVKFILARPVVEREVWAQLIPELKALTFTIKLVQDADSEIRKAEALKAMEDAKALIATIPEGGDQKKIIRQITAMLSPYFPTPGQAQRRAELLVRHWSGIAYGAAQWRIMDRQRKAFPYWKYVTFGDDRVRDSHAALNGKILPCDSPFWDTHYPPWAPMCRCIVVPVSQREYDRLRPAEEKLEAARRNIMEGRQLEELEKSNRLLIAPRFPQRDGSVRYGNLENISVAPEPGWTGWNPRDLRISFAALQQRYKDRPGDLAKLLKTADGITLAPGITLGHYIRGLGEGEKLPAIQI